MTRARKTSSADSGDLFAALPSAAAAAAPVKREPDTHCPDCGAALVFDALKEGETCGGLRLIGWMHCTGCGKHWHAGKRARVGGEQWRITGSGRSLDAEGTRLRAESGDAHVDVAGLMRRIARLPELEAALRMIARGCDDPAAAAKAALEEMRTTSPPSGCATDLHIIEDET